MYHPPDYYEIDALLTDEHRMIRTAVREWVNRNVKPIVEDYAQQHKPLPVELMRQMGEPGALGPGDGDTCRLSFTNKPSENR